MRFACALLLLLLAAACGDDGTPKPKDGGPDSGSDAIDGPGSDGSGACGSQRLLAGEVIDFRSGTGGFCGVFGATLTARGTSNAAGPTPPNGRFDLCVPAGAPPPVDIAPSADPSPCASNPGRYEYNYVIQASDAFLASGDLFSARLLSTQSTVGIYGLTGHTYTSTAAQLVVHQSGTPVEISIDVPTTNGSPIAFDGTTWALGRTGVDVLFPNLAAGTVTVTPAGGTPQTYTLAASQFTYVGVP